MGIAIPPLNFLISLNAIAGSTAANRAIALRPGCRADLFSSLIEP
ncbi:hypothetical protein [Methylomonas koyamae]|nr:hypothetical protein [Methylomonas koyamae]